MTIKEFNDEFNFEYLTAKNIDGVLTVLTDKEPEDEEIINSERKIIITENCNLFSSLKVNFKNSNLDAIGIISEFKDYNSFVSFLIEKDIRVSDVIVAGDKSHIITSLSDLIFDKIKSAINDCDVHIIVQN